MLVSAMIYGYADTAGPPRHSFLFFSDLTRYRQGHIHLDLHVDASTDR